MKIGFEKGQRYSCLMFGYETLVFAIDDPVEKPPNSKKQSDRIRSPISELGSNLTEKTQ
ncbi:hypothetical protein [Parasphingorhabdus sp.]|uniref:hypothetical protein n=1 Tax=Parasphingorhabdus sp. TaxID=2709688 RepID=UPI003BAF41EE